MGSCNSRVWRRFALPLLCGIAFLGTNAWAEGPRYSFLGASYQWTDSKFGVDPSNDSSFNNGDFEGFNVEGSLAIVSFLHLAGQYFDGDCNNCGTTSSDSVTDLDYEGFKVGLGYNQSLDLIGLNENADLVLRANFVDVELGAIDDDGWSAEAHLKYQVSDRAEVGIGYEYQDVGDVENRDLLINLTYEIAAGIALTADGIIFDDDTGFALGVRWYFMDAFTDRDSIVR